ncbi:hypothetical protein CQZ93_14890 [Ochrobactrum vermis]|nr:hypothetical protein CQZ93_14890 [Ochrobactrum vermis]
MKFTKIDIVIILVLIIIGVFLYSYLGGAVSGRNYTDGEYVLLLKGIQGGITVGWVTYWGELLYEITPFSFAVYFIIRHVFNLK